MVDLCELFCKGTCHSLGSPILLSLIKTLWNIAKLDLQLSSFCYAKNCYLEGKKTINNKFKLLSLSIN